MRDNAEHDDGPKVVNASLPEWAKFAGTIIITIGAMFTWATSTFVSRVEWTQHAEQQRVDLNRVTEVQSSYAHAEKGTASNLSEINSRLTRIETLLETANPRSTKHLP